MAEALGVSIADLIYEERSKPTKATPRPVGELQRLFEGVRKLPRRQQTKIIEMLRAMLHEYERKAS